MYDPKALHVFDDNEVIIPITVLDELDNAKVRPDEPGRNARSIVRELDNLRAFGSLSEGVKLGKSTIRVELNHRHNIPQGLSEEKKDNRLISTALGLQGEDKVIIVTKDINLRVKCDALGIEAQDYTKDKIASDLQSIYSGVEILEVSSGLIDSLYENDSVDIEGVKGYKNQFFILKAGSQSAITRCNQNGKLESCRFPSEVWGIMPRNVEQKMAFNLLLDPKIKLVTLIGKAGSGKTLIACTAALHQVLSNSKVFHRALISRPIQPMGRDIGYLPGSIEEKLIPWMQPIYDNLEFLLGGDQQMLNEYKYNGLIQVEPLTYIRGRSIPKSFLILDECFPYNQHVVVEGDKKIKIGKLYEMFQKGLSIPKVKSYNESKQTFEYHNLTNAWKKSPKKLIELSFANRKIRCTYNHKILTPSGWKMARDLEVGDFAITTEPNSFQLLRELNDDQYQVLIGSFLGDGHVSKVGLHRYRLKISHSSKQDKYCNWKAKIFNRNTKIVKNGGYGEKLSCFWTLTFGMDKDFPENKHTCPQWIIDDLDERALAIWFMDDGYVNKNKNQATLSTCSFDRDSQVRIIEKLKKMGISCFLKWYKAKKHVSDGYYYIVFNKEGCDALLKLIHPYTCNDMSYKVGPCNGEQYSWNNEYKPYGLTVLDNIKYPEKEEEVYDIEVEKTHNFIACSSSRGKFKNCSGIVVHNCQNMTAQEVKTVITRMGEESKIVITGDIEQIDNPYVDFADNGLTHVIERFKDHQIAGHVTLQRGERSELATLASEIL